MKKTKSTKKAKLAEGFALPTPTRAPVPEEAARRFEAAAEPAPSPAPPTPASSPTPPPPAAAKKTALATSRFTLRVHPNTFKETEDFAWEHRMTQKRVIVEGLKALGIKVAPSDLE